jgi:hypothetical protein
MQRNEDVNHISNFKLRGAIQSILDICPAYTTAEARDVLLTCNGNLSDALNQIFDYPPEAAFALPDRSREGAAATTIPKPLLLSPTLSEPSKFPSGRAPHTSGVVPSIVVHTGRGNRPRGVKPTLEGDLSGENSKDTSPVPPVKSSFTPLVKHKWDESEDDGKSFRESTFNEKATKLHGIFPMATLDDCEKAVNCCNGIMDEAVQFLEEDHNLCGNSIVTGQDSRRENRVAGFGANVCQERGRSRDRGGCSQKRCRTDSLVSSYVSSESLPNNVSDLETYSVLGG